MKKRCNETSVIYNTVYTHPQCKADEDPERKKLKSEGLAGYTTMPLPFFSHTNTWGIAHKSLKSSFNYILVTSLK